MGKRQKTKSSRVSAEDDGSPVLDASLSQSLMDRMRSSRLSTAMTNASMGRISDVSQLIPRAESTRLSMAIPPDLLNSRRKPTHEMRFDLQDDQFSSFGQVDTEPSSSRQRKRKLFSAGNTVLHKTKTPVSRKVAEVEMPGHENIVISSDVEEQRELEAGSHVSREDSESPEIPSQDSRLTPGKDADTSEIPSQDSQLTPGKDSDRSSGEVVNASCEISESSQLSGVVTSPLHRSRQSSGAKTDHQRHQQSPSKRGILSSPARAADVGIAVNTVTHIPSNSSDVESIVSGVVVNKLHKSLSNTPTRGKQRQIRDKKLSSDAGHSFHQPSREVQDVLPLTKLSGNEESSSKPHGLKSVLRDRGTKSSSVELADIEKSRSKPNRSRANSKGQVARRSSTELSDNKKSRSRNKGQATRSSGTESSDDEKSRSKPNRSRSSNKGTAARSSSTESSETEKSRSKPDRSRSSNKGTAARSSSTESSETEKSRSKPDRSRSSNKGTAARSSSTESSETEKSRSKPDRSRSSNKGQAASSSSKELSETETSRSKPDRSRSSHAKTVTNSSSQDISSSEAEGYRTSNLEGQGKTGGESCLMPAPRQSVKSGSNAGLHKRVASGESSPHAAKRRRISLTSFDKHMRDWKFVQDHVLLLRTPFKLDEEVKEKIRVWKEKAGQRTKEKLPTAVVNRVLSKLSKNMDKELSRRYSQQNVRTLLCELDQQWRVKDTSSKPLPNLNTSTNLEDCLRTYPARWLDNEQGNEEFVSLSERYTALRKQLINMSALYKKEGEKNKARKAFASTLCGLEDLMQGDSGQSLNIEIQRTRSLVSKISEKLSLSRSAGGTGETQHIIGSQSALKSLACPTPHQDIVNKMFAS